VGRPCFNNQRFLRAEDKVGGIGIPSKRKKFTRAHREWMVELTQRPKSV
jgi:hypothetical protein